MSEQPEFGNNEENNNFLFDDFFVPEDDQGHKVEVELKDVNGHKRTVEIFIKRGLNFADRDAAKAKAVQTRLNPKNGQLEMVGADDGIFQLELLNKTIKSWPFKYKNGKPVEINRQNISLLLSDSVDVLVQEVLKLLQAQENSLDFFEKTSDEAS